MNVIGALGRKAAALRDEVAAMAKVAPNPAYPEPTRTLESPTTAPSPSRLCSIREILPETFRIQIQRF
jgi:hypothetical protein